MRLYSDVLMNFLLLRTFSLIDSTVIHASSVSTNVTESSSLSNVRSQNINSGDNVPVRVNVEERQVERGK